MTSLNLDIILLSCLIMECKVTDNELKLLVILVNKIQTILTKLNNT